MPTAREEVPTILADNATVAAFLRVTPSAVRKATRSQDLPVELKGAAGKAAKFDLGAVGRWFEKRITTRALAGVDPSARGPGLLDLTQERAKLSREQRIARSLANERLKGELIPVAVFGHAWGNFASAVRSRLEALPLHIKRAQPELSAAALEVVEREVAAALEDLARLRFDPNADIAATGELPDPDADDDATLVEFLPPDGPATPHSGASA